MQSLLEDLIRALGWSVLQALTLGRYASRGSSAALFEGTIGLLVVAGISWAAYQWVPSP